MNYRAYTDGSSHPSQKRDGAAATVIVQGGKLVCAITEYLPVATCNRAELIAIRHAAEWSIDHGKPLTIYTDSQYAVLVLTKRKFKGIKANRDLVIPIRELLKSSGCSLVWVRGHNGTKFNEWADALANKSLACRKSYRKDAPTTPVYVPDPST